MFPTIVGCRQFTILSFTRQYNTQFQFEQFNSFRNKITGNDC